MPSGTRITSWTFTMGYRLNSDAHQGSAAANGSPDAYTVSGQLIDRQEGRSLTIVPEIIRGNEEYAQQFSTGHLTMLPSRKVVILTCMDARIEPLRVLGLKEGEAHILRNAGGRVSEAIRSIALSQEFQGTREIVLLYHKNCGLLGNSNERIRERLGKALGDDAAAVAEQIDFDPHTDVVEKLKCEIALLKQSPLIRAETAISGFVFDETTGRIEQVV